MATRPLQGVESFWATPSVGVSVQLAIKLADEKLLPKAIQNMKKLFYATKIKVVDGAFHQLLINNDDILVHRMPNYIQSCKSACQWMFDNQYIDITKSLCNIAANDNIVVVNANHAVHDAGYSYKVLQHCLDDNLPQMPALPLLTFEAYKPEIEAVEKSGEYVIRKEVSSIPNDINSKYLAPKDTKWSYHIIEEPASNLSCFDKKSGRPKGLTEFMWVGLGMVLGTASNNIKNIGSTLIVDLRRVICPERVDWSFGVTPGAPNFSIKTNPNMKVKEAMKIFRNQVDGLSKDNGFVKELIAQFKPGKMSNDIVGCLSNAGPMMFKHPIQDFYLKSTDYGYGNDSIFSIFSYSKVGNGRNQCIITFRTAPANITRKMDAVLRGSFMHWMKNISPDMTIKDAHEEMKSVQSLITKNY